MELEFLLSAVVVRVVVYSSLVLGVSAVVGLAAAVVQAATQVQDQTFAYVLKFLAVSAVLAVGADRIAADSVAFTADVFQSIAEWGQLSER